MHILALALALTVALLHARPSINFVQARFKVQTLKWLIAESQDRVCWRSVKYPTNLNIVVSWVKSHQKSLRKSKFKNNYFPGEHATRFWHALHTIPCAEFGPKGFSPSYSPVIRLLVKLTKCFDGKIADFLLTSFDFPLTTPKSQSRSTIAHGSKDPCRNLYVDETIQTSARHNGGTIVSL